MENILEKTIQHLKEHEVRITPQRRAIIQYLIDAKNHPSVEMIYRELIINHPNMSIATVYNTLTLLKKHGFVKELQTESASSRFDFHDETEHFHLICLNCGQIIDFYYPLSNTLEKVVGKVKGFIIQDYSLKVEGYCEECVEIIKQKDA